MPDDKSSTEKRTVSPTEDKSLDRGREMKLAASLSFQVGCLTVVVAGLALAAGLWLDARFETVPRWTLILVLGSVPISMGVIFFLARRAIRSREDDKSSPEDMGQD